MTGNPPPTQSTYTSTVTVTTRPGATPTQATCPIAEWGQCGGQGYVGSCAGNCAGNSVCKYKDGKQLDARKYWRVSLINSPCSVVFLLQQLTKRRSCCIHSVCELEGVLARDNIWSNIQLSGRSVEGSYRLEGRGKKECDNTNIQPI